MHDTDVNAPDRTAYERSPSCGTFETAEIYGCPDAHDIEETPEDSEEIADLEDTTMLRESSIALEVAL